MDAGHLLWVACTSQLKDNACYAASPQAACLSTTAVLSTLVSSLFMACPAYSRTESP